MTPCLGPTFAEQGAIVPILGFMIPDIGPGGTTSSAKVLRKISDPWLHSA